MTSKEALEILLAGYYNNANYQELIEAREKLEKDLERLSRLVVENGLLKKDLIDYQAYIKKGVEEHYKDFMSNYDFLLQGYQELYKRLEVLEILKKWIVVDETYDDLFPYEIKLRNGYVSNRSCLVFTKDDYEKVKEWLEDE